VIGALCLLLGCELAGEALRYAARLPVPGPVMGMLLLAVILIISRRRPSDAIGECDPPPALDRVSEFLISNMGVLFVPAGVGVITQASVLRAEWLPILVGVLGSTLVGLVVTALVMNWMLPEPATAVEDALLAGGPR
jgi:holin-like protein